MYQFRFNLATAASHVGRHRGFHFSRSVATFFLCCILNCILQKFLFKKSPVVTDRIQLNHITVHLLNSVKATENGHHNSTRISLGPLVKSRISDT